MIANKFDHMSDKLAEQGIIGSLILEPHRIDDVFTMLKSEMFVGDAERTIYEAITALHGSNKKIDLTLLIKELNRRKVLESVGGQAHLGDLIRDVPNSYHLIEYSKIVRDCAVRRNIYQVANIIVAKTLDPEIDCEEIMNEADELIYQARDVHRVGLDQTQHIGDILMECLSRIDRRQAGESVGLKTGFHDLDKVMRLRAGELITIAARPGMGKTAFAMNIAANVARDDRVLYFSLEMGALELGERLLSSVCRIHHSHLRDGTMSHDENSSLLVQASELGQINNITIDDTAYRTAIDISAVARRMKRKEGLSLVVIDYLQLISTTDKKLPRHEQVANMTRSLKQLARELQIPVVILAQLNRQTEATNETRPKLSHLRESGAIEQDSDTVIFVHREAYFAKDKNTRDQLDGKAELIIAKQRNGRTDIVPVAWSAECMRFDNLSTRIASENHEHAFDNYSPTTNEF